MSTSDQSLEAQFDRLVDGELSQAEYRSLLASLDDQPDGWRRCALAFLEAQALGRDLSAVRQAALTTDTAAAASPSVDHAVQLQAERPDDWSQRTWQGLYFATIAASLALAFYVGSWTSGINDQATGPYITTLPSEQRSVEAPNDGTPHHSPSRTAESNAIASTEGPLGNVQLVMGGAESSQRVEVPVYGQKQIDRWHSTNKPVLPPQVIEQLQRAGHKVDHRQQWILVDTADGNQVLVPVDNYQIQPAQRPAY
jgi:hypothetical protein